MGPGRRRWWTRVDGPLPGAVNMARDHAGALSVPPDGGLLRFYGWVRPTLSLGRNEPADGRWDADRLRARGVDVVRRPTGGRAVLHHRELTYSVAIRAAGAGSMRSLYALVNRALVVGLRDLGVPAERSGRDGPAAEPDAGPCFHRPAEGEVVVAGRKLVGSAQVRLEGRLLQHGSLLLHDDQALLAELVPGREDGHDLAAALPGGPTSLAEWLDPLPSADDLVRVFSAAFSTVLGGDWHAGAAPPTLDPALVSGLERRYRSPTWTWRR